MVVVVLPAPFEPRNPSRISLHSVSASVPTLRTAPGQRQRPATHPQLGDIPYRRASQSLIFAQPVQRCLDRLQEMRTRPAHSSALEAM